VKYLPCLWRRTLAFAVAIHENPLLTARKGHLGWAGGKGKRQHVGFAPDAFLIATAGAAVSQPLHRSQTFSIPAYHSWTGAFALITLGVILTKFRKRGADRPLIFHDLPAPVCVFSEFFFKRQHWPAGYRPNSILVDRVGAISIWKIM